MPELPEVETTRRSVLPHIKHHKIQKVMVRQPSLRWPIPKILARKSSGATILDVKRRAKYLFVVTDRGTIIIHLGMSGHLRILLKMALPNKHDHVDLILENNKVLRFTDPRRFGAWLWTEQEPTQHVLLKNLGPEPFDKVFNAKYLFSASRRRKTTVKQFIMDSHIVVGIGNIYANEILFLAGIHPAKMVATLQPADCKKIIIFTRQVLRFAISAGGTTIRNFMHGENNGRPGYFKQQLWVYGRCGLLCKKCQEILQEIQLGQRRSVYCHYCQRL
jgi:formamidopyrimidine-DNA glycosylase